MSTVEKTTPLANCSGMTELFFDEEESLSTIYECRKVCANCSMFESCLEYGIEQFENPEGATYGVLAGYPRSAREAMYQGDLQTLDWRPGWDPSSYRLEGLMPPPTPCHVHTPVDGTCSTCGTRVRVLARR